MSGGRRCDGRAKVSPRPLDPSTGLSMSGPTRGRDHPHPNPLPSRERGLETTPSPLDGLCKDLVKGDGAGLCPIPRSRGWIPDRGWE